MSNTEENKGILIIGASGLIGRYLFNFLRQKQQGETEKRVMGTYNKNKKPELVHFDVTKPDFDKLSLDGVNLDCAKYAIACSAIAKIDECKRDVQNSHRVNVECLEKIIGDLSERGIVPVFMSGAAVFDGVKGGYKEEDKRNPINIYGKQKVEVEDFIISNIKDYLIIRLGKVFGIKKGEGGLFADWLCKYRNNETIVCADDEKLSVTYAGDLAKAINILLSRDAEGIFHINPKEHFSRFELATSFFKYLGIKDAKIERCSIDDFDFLEKRAKNSYLDASKFNEFVKCIEGTGFEFTPLEKCYDMIKADNF